MSYLIICIYTVFSTLSLTDLVGGDSEQFQPQFVVNFYFMGSDELTEMDVELIRQNMEYLNQEFEGFVGFKIGQIDKSSLGGHIPDLYKDYINRDSRRLRELVLPVEESGSINVFLFDTYRMAGEEAAMMGFTPILKDRPHIYGFNSPRFDRVYMAYRGLVDKTTLVHEMGHFFGLDHPWEMTPRQLVNFGLKGHAVHQNHMTYQPEVDRFTKEQLKAMRKFALSYRKYLMSPIQSTP